MEKGVGKQVKFCGIAVNERYYKPETSWGIFNIRTKDDLEHGQKITATNDRFLSADDVITEQIVTVVGNMQHLSIGAEYEFIATPEYNQKYDMWQYKPLSVMSLIPKTEEATKTFLMAILTEGQASTLLNVYPDIVNQVIAGEDDVDVSKLRGIGEKTWEKIRNKILDNFVISDLISLLKPHGITYSMITRMLKAEPNPNLLKEKILDDPYWLITVHGFGFKTVDSIATKMKPELRCSKRRTYAFLRYFLVETGESDGHTWVYMDKLTEAVHEYIPECDELLSEVIEAESNNGVFLHIEDDKVGLSKYYETERKIYNKLVELDKSEFFYNMNGYDMAQSIRDTEEEQGFEFTDEQMEAIIGALSHNVALLSGCAGAGKTSTSKAILNAYKDMGCNISACALSAKATRRITEATGFYAMTIHRLLRCKGGFFEINAENPLVTDVVFLDESSMVDASLFWSLLSALRPGTRIIICGDHLQLPPIGYGNVFTDLLQINTFSAFTLKTVHRQAAKSGILTDANRIREGQFPISNPATRVVSGEEKDMVYAFRDDRLNMRELAVRNFLAAAEKDGIDNVAMITPRKTNCTNSTDEINAIVQSRLFLKSTPSIKTGEQEFKLGARVIQIVNNYDKDVVNGEVGYVHDVDEMAKDKEECLIVRYKDENNEDKYVAYTRAELSQITLAYCLTVHKTQGSEWKDIIVVIDKAHYIMLDSCLLYTAITRAKKKCMLISEPDAFSTCIRKNKNITRQTWIGEKTFCQGG